MKKLLLWIVFSLCLMGVAAAETILVDPGGAGDYAEHHRGAQRGAGRG